VYQTGALTAQVNSNPQKVNSLVGVTLGAYASMLIHPLSNIDLANSMIQAASTLIGGTAVGLVYAWKPALVGIGWFLPQ